MKTFILQSVVCTFILSFGISCGNNYKVPNKFVDVKETIDPQLDDLLKDEMEQQDLVGMAVAVYENNDIQHLSSYGFKDWNTKSEWEFDDLSHWASISKPMTAVAAMKLEEEGHLSLDDKISDYLDYWPDDNNKDDITLKHLLSHRSGIDHHSSDFLDRDTYISTDSNFFNAGLSVIIFAGTDLLFNPGTNYDYSTQGFCLAGAYLDYVAKQVYGSDYDYVQLVQETVAEPLKLESLTPTDAANNRAKSHRKNCNYETVDFSVDPLNYVLPGGGWSSTIGDLMLFGKGVMEEQILEGPTINEMWTNRGSGAALGWFLAGFGNDRLVYHGGSKKGFKTFLGIFPEKDVVVAIMTNSIREGNHRYRILELIANHYNYSNPLNFIDPYDIYREIRCDTTTCDDQKNIFSGVWRAGNSDQLIRRNLTRNDFGDERNRLRNIGYEITDLEIHKRDNVILYDGVFSRQSEGIHMWRDFSTSAFEAKIMEEENSGYRLFDVEVVKDNGNFRWSGLFKAGSHDQIFEEGMTPSELESNKITYAGQGYRMIDIEPYYKFLPISWAGVWIKDGLNGQVRNDMAVHDFGNARLSLNTEGFRINDVEKYIDPLSGKKQYAGTFYENTSSGALLRNRTLCNIFENFRDYKSEGWELVDFEKHID